MPTVEITGPELTSHLEIALAVASGIADTALGLRATVTDLGLEFLPLTWESYDVALAAAALGAVRPLITAVTNPDVQGAISMIGGYDLTDAGTFHPVEEAPPPSPAPDTDDGQRPPDSVASAAARRRLATVSAQSAAACFVHVDGALFPLWLPWLRPGDPPG